MRNSRFGQAVAVIAALALAAAVCYLAQASEPGPTSMEQEQSVELHGQRMRKVLGGYEPDKNFCSNCGAYTLSAHCTRCGHARIGEIIVRAYCEKCERVSYFRRAGSYCRRCGEMMIWKEEKIPDPNY